MHLHPPITLKFILLFIFIININTCIKGQFYYEENKGWMDEARKPIDGINNMAINELLLPVDSRSMGMGGISTSFESRPNMVFDHISLLAKSKKEFSLSTNYHSLNNYNSDANSEMSSFSSFIKLKGNQSFAFGVQRFKYGKNCELGGENQESFDLDPINTILNIGYAKLIGCFMLIGITVKGINTSISKNRFRIGSVQFYDDYAIAANAELSYSRTFNDEQQFILSFAINNVGSKISYTKSINSLLLPSTANIHLGYLTKINAQTVLGVYYSASKPLIPSYYYVENHYFGYHSSIPNSLESNLSSLSDAPRGAIGEFLEINHAIGAESNYKDRINFRAGIQHYYSAFGHRVLPSFGLGLTIKEQIELDISYLRSFDEIWYLGENMWSISLTYSYL